MDNTASLIFPERTVEYASFLRRFIALLIDAIVLFIPTFFLRYIIGVTTVNIFNMDSDQLYRLTIYYLIDTIVRWLYFAIQESGVHQATIGKRAMEMRVTSLEGSRISFANATGRYFAKLISTLILLIGYFMVLFDDKNQGLHDKLAHTVVVKDTLPI